MGKATYTGTPGEMPVPDTTPEITPDRPERTPSAPEIKPERTPSPAAPQAPGKPDSPAREPEVEPARLGAALVEINPDNDPDLPEKPGPPLFDPESPRGAFKV